MADVFISYSRLDLERVKPIADRLTSLGYSIWWDQRLRAGQVFVDEIETQLDAARAVLTAWSRNSRDSTWVYAESSRGFEGGKFLQVRLDDVPLPLPFDALQVADMSSGRAQWGPLEDQLARLVRNGEAPPPLRPPQSVGALATPAAAGAPKLFTAGTGAALAAYAAAVSAAYNGVMSPEQLQIALFATLGIGGASALVSAQRLAAISRAGG